MPDPAIFGPATLSVTQGFQAFSMFLPKISEVRRASMDNNPDIVGDVRMGEVAAVTLCIGIGTIASSLTGSPVPAFTAVLMSGLLVGVYEYALRNERPFEPKTRNEASNGSPA